MLRVVEELLTLRPDWLPGASRLAVDPDAPEAPGYSRRGPAEGGIGPREEPAAVVLDDTEPALLAKG